MSADGVRQSGLSRGSTSLGTRFLVFPQPHFIAGYEKPEPVWVSTPLGSVLPGPSDDRIEVKDPRLDKIPYQGRYVPPFVGDTFPPAEPGPDGHFDHIDVKSRQFAAAHAYACVTRVLDIFDSYTGRRVPWYFAPSYERLELIPHVDWNNAHTGPGFMELGGPAQAWGERLPFAMNFDVVAHETGHLILLGVLGPPFPHHFTSGRASDFLAYHESIADLVSKISLLHFDTALDHILRRTRGNLFVMNELDRIAALSSEKQLRMASHSLKMSDVGPDVHDRSRPFTGAVFDTLLEIFQALLFERRHSKVDPSRYREFRLEYSPSEIENELGISRREYAIKHFAIKTALEEARDLVGDMLAGSWKYIDTFEFTFAMAAEAAVRALEEERGARFSEIAYRNFAWREVYE